MAGRDWGSGEGARGEEEEREATEGEAVCEEGVDWWRGRRLEEGRAFEVRFDARRFIKVVCGRQMISVKDAQNAGGSGFQFL